MTLKVNEIFYSIQGESSYAGFPCVFIRLTGCNLRCLYCDTTYAYEEGTDLTIKEIANRISQYNPFLVQVTGGEPLIQEETPQLISYLLNKGYKVMLETNGSLDIGGVDNRCKRILDLKLPGSGEVRMNLWGNLDLLTPHDEIKYVISHREDYEYAKESLHRIAPSLLRKIVINFSPAHNFLDPAELASWILEDKLFVRLNLQLHKYVWPEHGRGK